MRHPALVPIDQQAADLADLLRLAIVEARRIDQLGDRRAPEPQHLPWRLGALEQAIGRGVADLVLGP